MALTGGRIRGPTPSCRATRGRRSGTASSCVAWVRFTTLVFNCFYATSLALSAVSKHLRCRSRMFFIGSRTC